MRRVQARRAIAKVLLKNPKGLTGSEIIGLLDKNISRKSITDTRHVSNLIRGAKGIERIKNGGVQLTNAYNSLHEISTHSYKVVLYKVTDANALQDWVGGIK